jgi:organic hydroperoxide reductase OsmC/OhrA
MAHTHDYRVDLQWENDRLGLLSSPDLLHKLPVATPPPFPKGMEGYWSPEHLLTASVSSCLMTTFLAIAENSKLPFESFRCVANGKLEQVDGKYLMTEILAEPELVLFKDEDVPKALRILEKTEAACLISNSIKAKVILKSKIEVLKTA